MKTTVVNCRKKAYDVYIGRPSVYGNPFVIGKDGTREEVIKKYEAWLFGRLRVYGNVPPSRKQIKNELHGKVLGCYCSPLICHGDLLAEIADETDV